MMLKNTMIVTAALPYANGSIHIGHLVEYIQTDIFVRFQKMQGRDCRYICAVDTHGAPIMIRAKNENVAPEDIIQRYHEEHQRDFGDFLIEFDNFHSTNSDENRQLTDEIFGKLKDSGHIETRDIEQTYCENDKMFLPDRFVRGVCPKCGTEDQYGDLCESCGSHYSPTDLKKPKCALCGSLPVMRESTHYFFKITNFSGALEKFINSDALQPEVKNFLATWLKEGLNDWDCSRDAPYFGFTIPGEEQKYYYVWFDAPIGYIASTKNWADRAGADFDALWRDGDSEIHHFIGKDIAYLHTIYWIPMLSGSGFALPTKIHAHGHLTVKGEKMSKTRGTFINARTYLDHLGPEYLRYYYASKLRDSVDDIDLNFEDFVFRVNAELVNKIANLGSRTISILNKNKALENRLGECGGADKSIVADMQGQGEQIADYYDTLDYATAIKKIAAMADVANKYIDDAKPWELKDDPDKLREVLTIGINAFRLITLYLKPVTPGFAQQVEKILQIDPLAWDDHKTLLENHVVGKFARLIDRIDIKATEKIVEASRVEPEPAKPETASIEYDDFAKLDLRTAKIIKAEKIKKAEKLLKLTVEVGDEQRTLVAGIAKSYSPEDIIGKTVVIVANLKPRKLMGVTSHGMVLAATDSGVCSLITPDKESGSGIKVS